MTAIAFTELLSHPAGLLLVPVVLLSVVVYILSQLPSIADLRSRSYCRCKATSTDFNERVIPQLEQVPYNVPFWYNKHLGSTIPFGYHPGLEFDRKVYSHDCGAAFAADWYPSRPNAETSKICVFVPGLGSNTDHKYVQQFVRHMAAQGYTCVVVTARGVGMPLQTASVWHPALTDDVYKVLMTECPTHVPLFFVAFSAGTNILRHTLVRLHDEDRLAEPVRPAAAASTTASPAPDTTPSRRKTQGAGFAPATAPRILRSGRQYADSRTPASAVRRPKQHQRFLVKGAMSVCVAGEDYLQARTYLEQHHLHEHKHGPDCRPVEEGGEEEFKAKARAAAVAGAGSGLWGLCQRVLTSLEGLLYSLLMVKLYKSIIEANPQVEHMFDPELMRDMQSCALMSELDAKCNWRLFNFESEQHMVETFSVNRHEVREKVAVPMLLLQPLDDPLHKSNPYYSIEVDMYIENPNIIYAEIDHGNHFGFYEGNNLLNIFENKRCYTYPPKLATVFFQNIIDQEKRE